MQRLIGYVAIVAFLMAGCAPSAEQIKHLLAENPEIIAAAVEENPQAVLSAIEKDPERFMAVVNAAAQAARAKAQAEEARREGEEREAELVRACRSMRGNISRFSTRPLNLVTGSNSPACATSW